MSTASEDRDLSVSLEWPVDPLTAPTFTSEREITPTSLLERLDALERTASGHEPVDGELFEMAARLEHVVSELAEAMRMMNETMTTTLQRIADETVATIDARIAGLRTATMARLASREAEEQRTQRRDREALVARVQADMNTLSTALNQQVAALAASVGEGMSTTARSLTESVAASRAQTDVFADRVAAELQALRRRIPVKPKADGHAIDDATIEALVNRISDEVEIRVAAALKPKTRNRS